MQIKLNPVLRKAPKFEIDQKKFRLMLKQKKTAQRYDEHGEKHYNIKDNTVRYRKQAPIALKHDYMDGPFLLTIYKTGSELQSANNYVYQGYILVEEGEVARVYRDSLLDGYTEAFFTDDSTLLMDVRNKDTKEKFAVQIDGEPTLAYCGKENIQSCYDFEHYDDANHTNAKMIETQTKKVAQELWIKPENSYAIIQLDC